MVLRNLNACGGSGCAWMKSTMCISKSEIPWWSHWLKWCPIVSLTFLDVIQMALEPVHEPSLGLAYILCGAILAGDAVC